MKNQDKSVLAEAQLHLGINYLYGSDDVKQNRHLAISYLKKSAESGNKKAYLLLNSNYSALLHIPVKMNAFSGKREHLRFPKHCLS